MAKKNREIYQQDLFGFSDDQFKIPNDNDVYLLEFFAGIGFTRLGIQRVYPNLISHKICEWAIPSIIGYDAVHNKEKHFDLSKADGMDKEQLIQTLLKYGVSKDYNAPATYKELKVIKEDKLKEIYCSIIRTNNLVNIMNVKGEDLEITDTEHRTYICTWSFPCQSISAAGKHEGFEISQAEENGTRSGLCWEFVRILSECKEKPQVLICENVSLIHSTDNMDTFNRLMSELEKLGYRNHWQDLNGVDYGVPQNRVRFFCVSIYDPLGVYHYSFPHPIKLDKRLKDLLEPNESVANRFYLSEKLLDCFLNEGTGTYPRRERFLSNVNRKNDDIANAVTTSPSSRPEGNYIITNKRLFDTIVNEKLEEGQFIDAYNKNVRKDGICGSLTTRIDADNNHFVVGLKRGYSVKVKKETENPQGIDILGNYSKSNFAQTPIVNKNGVAPCVTDNHGQVTAIVVEGKKKTMAQRINDNIVKDDVASAITTNTNFTGNGVNLILTTENNKNDGGDTTPKVIGGIGEKKSNGGTQFYEQNRRCDSARVATCIPAESSFHPYYADEEELEKNMESDDGNILYCIRKLTPKECIRLMSAEDWVYERLANIGKLSDSQIFHIAGDGLIANIPEMLVRKMKEDE